MRIASARLAILFNDFLIDVTPSEYATVCVVSLIVVLIHKQAV
jgi:hypothetical protein